MRTFFGIVLSFILATSVNAKEKDVLGSVAWVQDSAEFHAIVIQTFKTAKMQLPIALEDKNWTAALEQFERKGIENLPPAVLMDLDDTIISSMEYRAYLQLDNEEHNRSDWEKWIAYEKAPLIPGVIDFIKETARLGIKIVITSNRFCLPVRQDDCPIKTQTLAMLRRAGLVFDRDDLLFRNEQPDWRLDKSSRRLFLSKRYRILLIIGDDLDDMITNVADTPSPSRRLYTEQYTNMWGERWFMLPNPVYGSWRKVAGPKLKTVIKGYKR